MLEKESMSVKILNNMHVNQIKYNLTPLCYMYESKQTKCSGFFSNPWYLQSRSDMYQIDHQWMIRPLSDCAIRFKSHAAMIQKVAKDEKQN